MFPVEGPAIFKLKLAASSSLPAHFVHRVCVQHSPFSVKMFIYCLYKPSFSLVVCKISDLKVNRNFFFFKSVDEVILFNTNQGHYFYDIIRYDEDLSFQQEFFSYMGPSVHCSDTSEPKAICHVKSNSVGFGFIIPRCSSDYRIL